ncbi:MAG: response regulator [Polyangiaceae bacterium]|nr:response regulator [Polyangiaceae bacterium]
MEQASGDGTTKVVLVEDHDDSRALVAELLRMTGFDVTECPTPESALAELEASTFDIIVTDLTLEGMSGADLVRQARALPRFAKLPAIAVTGRSSLTDEERAVFGVVLVKPIDPAKLARSITQLTESSRAASDASGPPSSDSRATPA